MAVKLQIRGQLLVAFGIVMASGLGAGLFIQMSNQTMKQNVDWTIHTYNVMQATDRVLGSLVNQETGIRGYLVTGNDANLDPLRAGERDFKDALDEAKGLTSDNATQQKRLSDDLTTQSSSLENEVRQFVESLRAA